jgi:hypothetical protein
MAYRQRRSNVSQSLATPFILEHYMCPHAPKAATPVILRFPAKIPGLAA